MAGEKLGADRQFVRGEAQRLARDRLRDAVQLKKNVARADRRDPIFRRALALTHSGFRRTRGHGLVRENADPELAFALHVAGQRDAGGFDLRVGDPGALERLQAELAEIDRDIARSRSPCGYPRWVLRYFTRFGINGIAVSLIKVLLSY